MVMPCSRSALRPSVSSARSTPPASPVVPNFDRIALHGGKLIFVDHLGVMQQPADERGFAIIDRAAGKKAQKLFLLMPVEVGVNVFGECGVHGIR